jgi:hypothetical protein
MKRMIADGGGIYRRLGLRQAAENTLTTRDALGNPGEACGNAASADTIYPDDTETLMAAAGPC